MSIISSNNAGLKSVKIKLEDFKKFGWKLSEISFALAAPGMPWEKWAFHEEFQIKIRIVYDHKGYVEHATVMESKYVPLNQLHLDLAKMYNTYDLYRFMEYMNFLKENSYLFP